MKRISKKVREEACQLLSAAASNEDGVTDSIGAATLEASRAAWSLTHEAMKAAVDRLKAPLSYDANDEGQFMQHRMVRAEAECLLRTGWSPQ